MEIRKALNKIAEENSIGNISDEILIKACDSYKIKSDEFEDSYEYNIYVAKSLFDHLHGIEPDDEICKAIVPGQTKIVDGIMYIYTATPGAKTTYDWRVFHGKKNIGRQIVDGSKQSIEKQKYINELFPVDLKSLKTISKLGGSTGAELVEDSNGNQYVMKKGSNTSNEHVRAEYLTNQLYDLMGLRVPDYELYEENGEAILLSKFIFMATEPSVENYDEMAKGFVVDALLANFDIYQNDNCLVDSSDRIIRVDNGGALNYRAQGGSKNFGGDVKIEFDSMIKYNPSIVANLTTKDYIDQIDEVLKKKDDVVNFLIESNSNLSSIFDQRFKSLETIRNDLESKLIKNNKVVLERKLKSDADMYRDFSEDELKTFWEKQSGNDFNSKIFSTNDTVGWELLSSICQERGFDARPKVVDETSYWNIVKQSKYQMFRGIEHGNKDADFYASSFKYNDNCFFGTIGIYGSGIYMHVNDGTKNQDKTQTTYKNSDAYKAAKSYAVKSNVILECCLESNAKIANVEDLREEILSLVTFDKAAVDEKQKEIDSLNSQLNKSKDEYKNLTINAETDVKNKMHWDEDTLVMSQLDIDNTDWGKIDDEGNPDYPKFDDFVKTKMFDWVKKNGGTVTEKGKDTDVYVFKLPNSKESFMLSKYQYENNAIKRKNAFSNPYNYPVKRFQEWLMNNHYKIITKAVEKELKTVGGKAVNLQSDIKALESELNKSVKEMSNLKKSKNPNGDIISGIYESVSDDRDEGIGVYAALKGYDALIYPHGNGGSNSFMIVLNRSKVIVKK
jgi:hypothetical protein